ncbi:MAG: YsnF/AvaK domain-containing protein [Ktedonobacteraceae bacterium]
MADVRQSVVVGAFSSRKQAEDAIIALQKAGFQNDQIRQFAGKGAERSSLSGIKGIFSSERMARGDISRDLVDMGVSSEDTPFYQQEYEAGHPLVSVASSKRLPEATAILLNHDAYVPTSAHASSGQMAQRETRTMPDQDQSRTMSGQEQYGNLHDEQHMRLHAEQIQAYKQPAQVGEVILRRELVTEQQTIDVPVNHEEVVIERRAITGEASASDEIMGENQTIRIPVSEDRVNLTKHVVTTGEVVVGKRDRQEVQHFSDTVQHEEARWEQKGDAHIIWEKGSEPPPAQRGL